MICASLTSGKEVLAYTSMDIAPITDGGSETTVWSFELIPPDLNARNLGISVYFWARNKNAFNVAYIEVVFHDLEPYCSIVPPA